MSHTVYNSTNSTLAIEGIGLIPAGRLRSTESITPTLLNLRFLKQVEITPFDPSIVYAVTNTSGRILFGSDGSVLNPSSLIQYYGEENLSTWTDQYYVGDVLITPTPGSLVPPAGSPSPTLQNLLSSSADVTLNLVSFQGASMDTSAANLACSLVSPTSGDGNRCTVKNIGSNNILVTSAAGRLIDGSISATVAPYASLDFLWVTQTEEWIIV